MTPLKHGDTDGPVHFTVRIGKQPANFSGRTVHARFLRTHPSHPPHPSYTKELTPVALGIAAWQPTLADYAELPPGTYDVEIHMVNDSDPAKKRISPTEGYGKIRINPSIA